MKHCFRLLRLYYSTVKTHSGRFQIDFLPWDNFFSKISSSDNHTPFVFRIILKVGRFPTCQPPREFPSAADFIAKCRSLHSPYPA